MTDEPVVDRVDSAVCTIPTETPEADGTLSWDHTALWDAKSRLLDVPLGGYGAKQAVRLSAALEGEGVTWFEEPVSADRPATLAEIRGRVEAEVTAGEYGYTLPYFRAMPDTGTVDCLQADVTTGWLRVAAPALAHGLEISAHCAPHAHAHAAAAVPNLRHIEWFHDHVRVERLLFDGVLDPLGGAVTVHGPGLGLRLDAEQARPFRTR
ncbi:hypothetical protein IAG44_36105 [Streptomyces roseirectus]|uniref:Enolase C-terminal domain-containing protein n=1 Tax=Streptomyces roseirectus TaxID=2768066 RepID=A0A7H0INI6_9ACTN|nr:hypothetical protein IAG44_36105 [Streptomyces roseirectus]